MTDYIETRIKGGKTIRIEVEATHKTAAGFSARPSSATNVSSKAVDDAYDQTLDVIRSWANGITDTLQDLKTPPSNAAIEFAVKIDAEVGAMIAKSPGDAQFKVSLSWKQDEPEKDREKR